MDGREIDLGFSDDLAQRHRAVALLGEHALGGIEKLLPGVNHTIQSIVLIMLIRFCGECAARR
jgi:hypothetical protein